MTCDISLSQGWAIKLPEGPHWVLDHDEWARQVAQKNNPPDLDRGLTKNCA